MVVLYRYVEEEPRFHAMKDLVRVRIYHLRVQTARTGGGLQEWVSSVIFPRIVPKNEASAMKDVDRVSFCNFTTHELRLEFY